MTITKKEKRLIIKTLVLTIGGVFVFSAFGEGSFLNNISPITKGLIGVIIFIGGAFLFDIS